MDQLHNMLIQERHPSYTSIRDYLHFSCQPHSEISALDRQQLCQWAYSILSACSFDNSIGSVAFSYFDRFLSSHHPRAKFAMTSRHEFQLAFVTALVLALKVRCGMNVELDFVSDRICCGLYPQEDLVEMEKEMLMALGWRLNGPTSHDFIEYFVELLPEQDDFESFKTSLAEDAKSRASSVVMDYSQVLRLPSSIAFESLVEAIQEVGKERFHPYHKLQFLQRISMVTGIGAGHVFSSNSSPAQDHQVSITSSPRTTATESIVCLASQVSEHFMHGQQKGSSYRRIVSPSA
ncbi:hypothetical protein HJC23_008027 [Cyclotella cryptica]|uniref:Cyclin N-terminal domain-containing protein n=1 Tax=Cyclotella cryptica TaxID=29204 RepID=A0ABD3Q4W1_9STRA|eukprot:CCRYP_009143-RA/>CCRYP_009143-RA protein AED:0.19 eAED:0.19 QI:0/-1/0/1/-1/1/1/0/291